jgi:hypothetical protein
MVTKSDTPGSECQPSPEVDLGGGAVVSVLGADLHTAGACRFNPAPVEHAAVHVVSSVLVRCEVGLYKLNAVMTHSLKAPGFNH